MGKEPGFQGLFPADFQAGMWPCSLTQFLASRGSQRDLGVTPCAAFPGFSLSPLAGSAVPDLPPMLRRAGAQAAPAKTGDGGGSGD